MKKYYRVYAVETGVLTPVSGGQFTHEEAANEFVANNTTHDALTVLPVWEKES